LYAARIRLYINHPQLPEGFSNKFFWLPTQQRYAEFEKQDFETQYRIYIYGSQEIEPPDIGLAWVFAKQGGKIVQLLEAKLDSADDDATIQNIVFVFAAMSDLEAYDVPANKPLMQKLLEKQGAVKDPALAIMVQDDLHEITFRCKCELRK